MTSKVVIAQLCRELNKKMKPDVNSVDLYSNSFSEQGQSFVIAREGRLKVTAERWKLLKKIHNINKRINARPCVYYRNGKLLPEYYAEGCNHTIAKYSRLMTAGISKSDMRLVVGTKINSTTPIAALVINFHSTELYLDNDSNDVHTEEEYLKNFAPLYYESDIVIGSRKQRAQKEISRQSRLGNNHILTINEGEIIMANNRIEIEGNLGRAPEIRQTPEANDFATMSVAVTESYYDKELKEWRNTTTQWFNVVAFGALEVSEARHLKSGSIVKVVGKLKTGEYVDAEGQKRTTIEVHATSLKEIVRRKKSNADMEQEAA